MPGKRPINADVPPHEQAGAQPTKAAEPVAPKRRKPIPAALKAVAGLVLVAIVFLVAAVLGGTGSKQEPSEPAPIPQPAAGEQAEAPASQTAEQLGYPAFATNNTTRVGGSDAAANAAAISLAVFPATAAAQRPAAVTLVDEADWQGAIAAAVLMAAPVQAPLLIADGEELPEPTAQALEALDPQGSAETRGAQAFSIGGGADPGGLKTTTVGGSEPAAAAAAIAALRERLTGAPPRHLVVVSETRPELAVPAAAWAARSGDPVLFTSPDRLPAATAKALKERRKTPVYVLGPSAAISSRVVREIAAIGNRVRRVSGEDPVANAIALARYADDGFGWDVNDPGHGFVVARSDAPLDAAVSAPLSASGTWGPLLLTDDAARLPDALRGYLLDVKPGYTTDPTRAFYNHVWVIGDQEAIDVNQQAEIDELAELARIGAEP